MFESVELVKRGTQDKHQLGSFTICGLLHHVAPQACCGAAGSHQQEEETRRKGEWSLVQDEPRHGGHEQRRCLRRKQLNEK